MPLAFKKRIHTTLWDVENTSLSTYSRDVLSYRELERIEVVRLKVLFKSNSR